VPAPTTPTTVAIIAADAVHRALLADAVATGCPARVHAAAPNDPEAHDLLAGAYVAITPCTGAPATRFAGLGLIAASGHPGPVLAIVPADEPALLDEALDCGATHALLQAPGYLDQVAATLRSLSRRAGAAAPAARLAELHATLREIRAENQALHELVDRLEGLAATDPLTGLANRRAFESRLDELFSGSARHAFDLSVLAIDLDGLKTVNDTLGHPAGDELIQTAARVLRDTCRRADVPARIGGDEFAVLLPHTDAPHAALVAQRLRQRFDDAARPVRERLAAASGVVRVLPRARKAPVPGMSIGVASRAATAATTPAALAAEADRALYAAKRDGKGRVVVLPAATALPIPPRAA
jgi:diguanylate cyclase (GGDEF)-like protein